MNRALITGSHGFVGTHLRRLLRQSGWLVAGLDRAKRNPGPEEIYLPADLTEYGSVREAVEAADPHVVFHLAGQTGREGDDPFREALDTNVFGTRNLLTALLDRGRPARFIVVGSSSQYGAVPKDENPIPETALLRPTGVYGWSKIAAEAVALAHHGQGGLEVVAARPFNHSGPGEPESRVCSAFAAQIARIEAGEKPVIWVGNLKSVRDISDVRDIVRGYLELALRGKGGRVYNLCSGRGVSVSQLLEILLNKSKVRVEVRSDPARQRPVDLPVQVGSFTRARKEIGWVPQISIETTMQDLLDDWRARLTITNKGGSIT